MVWHRQLDGKPLSVPLLWCLDITCPTSYLCSLKKQRLAESHHNAITRALLTASKPVLEAFSIQQHLAVWDGSDAGKDLSKLYKHFQKYYYSQLAVGFRNVAIRGFIYFLISKCHRLCFSKQPQRVRVLNLCSRQNRIECFSQKINSKNVQIVTTVSSKICHKNVQLILQTQGCSFIYAFMY